MKRFIGIFASIMAVYCGLSHADWITPRIGLIKPTTGQSDVWGTKINTNFQIIDASAAVLPIDLNDEVTGILPSANMVSTTAFTSKYNIFTDRNDFQTITASSVSVNGPLNISGLTANQCVQTGAGGLLTTSGASCGGSGGASALGVNQNGVQITSPTYAINILSPPFIATAVGGGTTAQFSLNPSSVTLKGNNVINLSDSLQSGATFYVSSGTVLGRFTSNEVRTSTFSVTGDGTVGGSLRVSGIGGFTVDNLTAGRCVETTTGGLLTSASAACGTGSGGGSSSLAVFDEGALISSPTAVIKFTGAGVTATLTGGATALVTIDGGSGSGDNLGNHIATMTVTIPSPFGLDSSTITTSTITVSSKLQLNDVWHTSAVEPIANAVTWDETNGFRSFGKFVVSSTWTANVDPILVVISTNPSLADYRDFVDLRGADGDVVPGINGIRWSGSGGTFPYASIRANNYSSGAFPTFVVIAGSDTSNNQGNFKITNHGPAGDGGKHCWALNDDRGQDISTDCADGATQVYGYTVNSAGVPLYFAKMDSGNNTPIMKIQRGNTTTYRFEIDNFGWITWLQTNNLRRTRLGIGDVSSDGMLTFKLPTSSGTVGQFLQYTSQSTGQLEFASTPLLTSTQTWSGNNIFTSSAGVQLDYLTSKSCLGTDSDGNLIQGTCSGGGGSSSLAIWDGTVKISSPTTDIRANASQFIITLAGSATSEWALDPSSVTLLGPTIDLGTETVGTLAYQVSLSTGVMGTVTAPGDNFGNHTATMTVTIPSPHGIQSSTGVFTSSLSVTGLTTATTAYFTGDVSLDGTTSIGYGKTIRFDDSGGSPDVSMTNPYGLGIDYLEIVAANGVGINVANANEGADLFTYKVYVSTLVATSSATVGSIRVSELSSGQCVQTGAGGLLTVTGSACGTGAGAGDNLGNHIATMTLTANYSIATSSMIISSNTIMAGTTFYANASPVFGVSPTLSDLVASRWVKTDANKKLITVQSTGTITVPFDGGGSVLTTGTTYWVHLPSSGTITRFDIEGAPSGSVSVVVSSATTFDSTFANGGRICASACPTLSSQGSASDTTLTGWTKGIGQDGVLYFVVNSAATLTRAVLSIRYAKDD